VVRSLGILLAAAAAAATGERDLFEMNAGDAVRVGRRTVRFLGLTERTEPYFQSADGKIVDAMVSAEIAVEIDGRRRTFTGGPFRMPAVLDGLAFLLGGTRNWSGGIVPDPLAKEVRLEIRDASRPWVDPGSLVFPIRNYRWRAAGYQHTYLALAMGQARVYYHRGEDMGMIPDLDQALAMKRLRVVAVPGLKGDGKSNSVTLEDAAGLVFRYAHMNTPHILPSLVPGVWLEAGAPLGLTGNTWQGGPVSDPHLHVEVRDAATGTFRNTFPLIVAAYRHSYPGELLPIGGGWRHLYAGESITLDGSLSLAGTGRKIVSYAWEFTDGSRADGPAVTRTYARPGTYSERLMVTDDRGRRDSDFVEVFVLERGAKQGAPYGFIDYYPVRGIRPGTEVRFHTRYPRGPDVTIDFGDGSRIPYAETATHRFAAPGTYVVTVSGPDRGAGPGTLRARVVVSRASAGL